MCRAIKLLKDGSCIPVAAKHLLSPGFLQCAEREASILKDVSGRWYTVPFHDLVKDPAGHAAWLVTG